MARGSLAAAVATLIEFEDEGGGEGESRRFVDMSVSLRLCDVVDRKPVAGSDEELIDLGGRWDRRAKKWSDDPAEFNRVIRLHRGQEAGARWLSDWFRRRQRGAKFVWGPDELRIWSLLLLGGRRGGKSHLSCVALVLFAVAFPGARVWAISPTQDETDELEAAIKTIAPREWYRFRGGGAGKPLQFRFANGARIMCLSGHKPGSLKRGRVDFALYNEGQNMTKKGWSQLRGAIADSGGLILIAANPPDTEIGQWIEDIYEQARAKKNHVKVFELSAVNNPFVEYDALADMEADLNDPIAFAREVEGKMLPIGDVVFHSWSDSELDGSIREVPADFVDVTAIETRKRLGRAFGYVVGLDFQQTPHMPAVIYKLFRDPKAPDPTEVIPWIVDEVVRADADENDLIDALEAMPRWQRGDRDEAKCYRGWIEDGDDPADPVHCGVIMDASAWWQDGAHSKGRTSDQVLRARKWTFLYRPQPNNPDGTEVKRNPDIIERCKATNAMLKNAKTRRRMFSCPHNELTNKAMKRWQNKNGFPHRTSEYAHICDAVSYVIYRLFGRPKKKTGGLEYRSVGKSTRASELRHW